MSLTSISIAELLEFLPDVGGSGACLFGTIFLLTFFSGLVEACVLVKEEPLSKLEEMDSSGEKKVFSARRGDDEAEIPILLFLPPGVHSEEVEEAL